MQGAGRKEGNTLEIYSRIIATGSYIPEKAVYNTELSGFLDTDDEWIYQRTGIRCRHILTEGNTSDMAVAAARSVLENAGADPLSIDLILTGSATPDYQTPNLSCQVQSAIGAANAFCAGLSAACTGFIYSLSAADKYIRSGIVKRALVIGAETISKTVDWTDRSTCVLFGDGAGGVLLEASDEPGLICEELGSDGSKAGVLTNGFFPAANAFNDVTPVSQADVFTHMDGREVFSFAVRKLISSIQNVSALSGVGLDKVKYIVPHQANYRIIEAVAKRLQIDSGRFYMNMDKYGNTSAASIPIALDEMNGQGMLERGDKLILSGFGGGLTWGTVLIEW